MEKEVWNKASEDSIGQRNYYESHLEKYSAGMRVEARIFTTDNKEFLKNIKAKIEAGDTLLKEDLKQFKSVTNFRAYEKGENKAVDLINWTVGLHETEADGMSYLVEVNSLLPPGQKKFEEVRANVISDYQDELEKNWIMALKSKYTVKLNVKGKKKAIAELTAKGKS
jgi:peptidyl-prolyl cis-trans isomerase SurA